MALFNRDRPAVGESLYGFLNRLAGLNWQASAFWLYETLGLHPSERNLSEATLRELAELSGAHLDEIRRLAWLPESTGFRVTKHFVPKWMVRRYNAAVCIECLAESRPHLAAWDFRPILLCHRHRARLIEFCPRCHAGLRRSRRKIHLCRHNHDLRQFVGEIDHVTDHQVLRGEKILRQALDGAALPLPPKVSALGPADIALLARLIGCLKTGRLLRAAKNWHLDDEKCTAIGLDLLRAWPTSFHRILNSCRAHSEHPLPLLEGSVDRFLKGRLRRDRALDYPAVIGEEIWSFAAAKGLILPAGNYHFTPPQFHDTYITPTAAAARLNLAPETVVRIAKECRWSGHRQLGQKSTSWLLRADIDAWDRASRGKIYLTAVAKAFKCEVGMIVDLVQHGCFGRDAQSRVPADRRATWYATKEELDAFSGFLAQSASHMRAGGVPVRWSAFVHRRWNRGLTIGAAISAAQSGTVSIAGWNPPRLTDVSFYLDDLLRLQGAGTEDELLTLTDIKREFSLSWERIGKIVDLGLFPFQQSSLKTKARLVTRRDARIAIARFERL